MDNQEWILLELKRLNKEIAMIHQDNRQILIEITRLKTQAGFWGAISGIVFAAIVTFILK